MPLISTSPYNVIPTNFTLDNVSFEHAFSLTNGSSPFALDIKPDGTKFYTYSSSNVHEYDILTPWNITTSVYNQSKSISTQDSIPTYVRFKPDGLKMYVSGDTNRRWYEYDLSVAWDISTATFLQNFSFNAQDRMVGFAFKPDGTKIYGMGLSNDTIYEYDLSVAWDISSTSFLQSKNVTSEDNNPTSIDVTPDGTRVFITGNVNDDVFQYDLSTAWDITSATFTKSYNIGTTINVGAIHIKPDDGTKMYVGVTPDAINEYNLT